MKDVVVPRKKTNQLGNTAYVQNSNDPQTSDKSDNQ